MATEEVMDTDGLLRLSLQRLSQEVRKDIPELTSVLSVHLLRTCGLIPAVERAERYRELGQFLPRGKWKRDIPDRKSGKSPVSHRSDRFPYRALG